MILRDDLVVLRPFRDDEIGTLQRHWGQRDPRSRPGKPLDIERIRRRVAHSGGFYRGRLDLAIEVNGRLIGDIQARANPTQTLPSGTMELGIEIFDAGNRRHGYGSRAVALLTRWLFEDARAERVQVSTAAENVGMRRALEGLGFPFEGILRSFMPGQTERDDYAMYAVTRSDWEGGVEGRRASGPG